MRVQGIGFFVGAVCAWACAPKASAAIRAAVAGMVRMAYFFIVFPWVDLKKNRQSLLCKRSRQG